MLHLLFLTHHYSGAQTYADQLIPKLRRLDGVVVDEVYLNDSVQEFEVVDMKDVSASGDGYLFRIPCYVPDRTMANSRVPELRVLLSWIMRIDAPVIVHCNDKAHIYFADRLREQCNRVKVVYTKHFLPLDCTWHALLASGKTEIGANAVDEMDKGADAVICVTAWARECLLGAGLPSDKIKVIFNGYGGRKPVRKTREERRMLRQRYGFEEDEFIILFVGRLEESKGVFELLDAFVRLSDCYDDVRLVLAGTGNYSGLFQSVSRHHAKITLTGYLNREQLSCFYHISDIGVIPSKTEQCSYVALEMMRWKVPVIAADIPGLNELIIPESGMPVPAYSCCKLPGHEADVQIDADRLLGAFVEMKNDKGKRIRLAAAGYRRWRIFYSADRMMRQTRAVYADLLDVD